jgi:GntR family transcriptional regulator
MFSQMLPSELELQHSYETSRNIIRDALAQLRTEGLIERHQGQGTLVVGRRYRHRVDQMGGFSPTGDSVSRELISCEKVNAPPVVA